jgi:hypothetical protein
VAGVIETLASILIVLAVVGWGIILRVAWKAWKSAAHIP